MKIRKKILSEKHLDILNSINNLALTSKSQSREIETILLIKIYFKL